MLIKDIPVNERPRERLINYGAKSLSNEELLSIILRCGTKNKSVKDLSLDLLNEIKSIDNMKDITINKLTNIKGFGVSKASIILSVVELGRRMYIKNNFIDNEKYVSPEIIFKRTKYLFSDKKQELFYCLYFNNKYQLIGKELLFIGTINKSIVHPREIFKYAYLYSAYSFCCIHNHPSGDVKPSREDIELTNALVEIGLVQKIPLVDHIIISNDNYYSFQDNGKINNR